MSRRLIALIFGALAVGLIAGCGSGGDSGGNGGEVTANSLSKVEYIKQVNAVCEKYRRLFAVEGAAYMKKRGALKPSEKVTALKMLLGSIGLPLAKEEAKGLRSLGAPKGTEAEVGKILAAFENWIGYSETAIDKTAKPDSSKARPSGDYKAHELAVKARELAEGFGLGESCPAI